MLGFPFSINCYSIYMLAPRTISISLRETIYPSIYFPKYIFHYPNLQILHHIREYSKNMNIYMLYYMHQFVYILLYTLDQLYSQMSIIHYINQNVYYFFVVKSNIKILHYIREYSKNTKF